MIESHSQSISHQPFSPNGENGAAQKFLELLCIVSFANLSYTIHFNLTMPTAFCGMTMVKWSDTFPRR